MAMRRAIVAGAFLSIAVAIVLVSSAGADELLHWRSRPPLPDAEGFAGMAAGVSDGRLIAAGGANFPAGYPWQGGKKAWYDAILVLDAADGAWRRAEVRLPRTLAYAVCATFEDAVIVAGGETGPGGGTGIANGTPAAEYRADVLRLRYRDGKIAIEDLPPLPRAAAHQCGAIVGTTLYLAGGSASPDASAALDVFWALDLSKATKEMRWVKSPTWPGAARMQAVAGVQGGKFFLFGGLELAADDDGKPRRVEPYLRDAYCFTPSPRGTGIASGTKGMWQRIADLPREAAAAASPALASGAAHLTIVGGTSAAAQHFDPQSHPGWPRDALVYHAVTDRWVTVDDAVPVGASRVTVPATTWLGEYVMVSGERSPGRRSPDVFAVEVQPRRADFGWVNYTSLGLYLAAMIGVGVYFSRRNKTTDDFFRGGQHIPWWAAGLSIFATMLSSLTYMAVPATAFAEGWTLFINNAYIVLMPLVVFVFLPFYRQLDVTSVYEYLERRFNAAARLGGSLLFMLFQGGRIAVVLYLPSLALSTVTDFNVVTCILIMGTVSIVYTMMGGIEAVVWTDVVQTFVLVGGALLSLALVLTRLDGGVMQIVHTVDAADRFFEPVTWGVDVNVAAASVWVIVVGSIFSNLLPYTASQDVVQRYMTTKDEASAARAIWTNAAIAVPANALFFVIGSALLAFYSAHPERLDPTMKNDAVFPLFIARELPVGLAGIVMAGVFAAAQSTISSSLNSIAACYVTDFHRRLRPGTTDVACLRVARLVTVLVGVAGTSAALLLALANVQSAYYVFLEILSLFGGTLAGLFVLGIFSRRANGAGAVVGAVASMAAVAAAKAIWSPSFFVYAPLGMTVLFAVGYAASLVLPAAGNDLTGLTIYTRRGGSEAARSR